jgi:hypothetical protein
MRESLAGNPYLFLGRRPFREARLRAYIVRQHRSGRPLAEIVTDPYVRRCGSESFCWKVIEDRGRSRPSSSRCSRRSSSSRRRGSALDATASLERLLCEGAAAAFREAVAPAALLDEALVEQPLDRRVQAAAEGPPEVRPRQADRVGELVEVSAGHVAERAEEIVLERSTVHLRQGTASRISAA